MNPPFGSRSPLFDHMNHVRDNPFEPKRQGTPDSWAHSPRREPEPVLNESERTITPRNLIMARGRVDTGPLVRCEADGWWWQGALCPPTWWWGADGRAVRRLRRRTRCEKEMYKVDRKALPFHGGNEGRRRHREGRMLKYTCERSKMNMVRHAEHVGGRDPVAPAQVAHGASTFAVGQRAELPCLS